MHGRRYGRPGGWQQAQQPDASGAAEWFAGRLPEDWFDGDPTVIVDREEITVIGKLPGLESPEEESAARASGRVSRFRDETRPERMTIADEARIATDARCPGASRSVVSESCSRTSQYR